MGPAQSGHVVAGMGSAIIFNFPPHDLPQVRTQGLMGQCGREPIGGCGDIIGEPAIGPVGLDRGEPCLFRVLETSGSELQRS